ncbi:MAG: HPr family phosphocarrier protein [Oscillospiraceae bacterium]|nr:HPr family phosphocarrier protein [Oscillospiraceae bacterium]
MVSFDYTIKDPMGFHARPVGIMVKAAAPYKASKVTVSYNDKTADGKRMFAVLGLQVNQGETITVTVDGESEQELADAIRDIFVSENL